MNCNTTRQNDLKWRKRYTGLKFDLVHFNGPQTKFIFDSLYKHPVGRKGEFWKPHLLGYWIVVNKSLYDHRRLRKQPKQSVIYSILGHPVNYCSVQWKLCIMTSIFLKVQCIIYQSSALLKTCQKFSALSFSILELECCDHTNNCASHFVVPLVPVICHSNVRE